ncbi:MAG: endonuclease [Hymenobacter sp.]|nr:endonuclease [Hymenobacter sp.]
MAKSTTYNALLARGIDSQKSNELISSGYTLSSLKQLTQDKLEALGIPAHAVKVILDENRPPIPKETVIQLLYESKKTCCVCRDSNRSIIIHHIDEWNQSRSHEESNLVVLCLHHHDEAHTKKELSLNLTKDHLLKFKEKWVESVKTNDAKLILGLANDVSRWDYINQLRLFELMYELDIEYKDIKSFRNLFALDIVNRDGLITPISKWKVTQKPSYHICDFGDGMYLSHYLKIITERIIQKLPIIDITNKINITEVKSLVKPGKYITANLGFYFSDIDLFETEKSQKRKAYYQGNSIRIEFIFDAWQCTSSSARFDALTGHRVAMPIIHVRGIQELSHDVLLIHGSCLAIGTWFDYHRESKGFSSPLYTGSDV